MKKILIVDDELSIRRSLYNPFKKNYQIETASNGSEAVNKIDKLVEELKNKLRVEVIPRLREQAEEFQVLTGKDFSSYWNL